MSNSKPEVIKPKKIKKPKKVNIDSLESLNEQIENLKCSLATAESMRTIAQAKFDKAQELEEKPKFIQKETKNKKKTSIKRNLL